MQARMKLHEHGIKLTYMLSTSILWHFEGILLHHHLFASLSQTKAYNMHTYETKLTPKEKIEISQNKLAQEVVMLA